jgi:hypothetical protein
MDFITQAYKLAEDILAITAAVQLTGQPAAAEQEVDAYTGLIEKRAPMVEKLTQLLKQDTSVNKSDKQKVDGVISEIIKLDSEHQRVMKHLRTSVMASLKETRSAQKLSQAYQQPFEMMRSVRLDAKQ